MKHDPFCTIFKIPCCPWLNQCECQCNCDFIMQVRADEKSKYINSEDSEK